MCKHQRRTLDNQHFNDTATRMEHWTISTSMTQPPERNTGQSVLQRHSHQKGTPDNQHFKDTATRKEHWIISKSGHSHPKGTIHNEHFQDGRQHRATHNKHFKDADTNNHPLSKRPRRWFCSVQFSPEHDGTYKCD